MTDADLDPTPASGADGPSNETIDIRLGLTSSLLGIVAAVAISAWGWSNTEAGQRLPVHFDANGAADRYGSRFEAFGVFPLVLIAATVLLTVIPRVDPRKSGLAKSAKAYNIAWVALVVLLVGVQFMAVRAVLGGQSSTFDVRLAMIGIGALLAVLGNYMPKTGSNWVFGIRTPWTLSDDRVWADTHRFGGRLLMALGLAAILGAFVVPTAYGIPAVALGAVFVALVTTFYSYQRHRTLTSGAGSNV